MATVGQIREAAFVGRFDDQMSAGAASAQRALKNLGATVVETDQVVTRSTRSAESWVRSADPMTAAANRAAAAQRNLSTASKALAADIAAGGEKQAAAERALEALAEKARRAKADLEALERGNASAASAISGVGNSARLTTRELQQLSPQIADIGVTLAGGMNPLMVLIQQGPQITDAVGGIGRAFTLLRAAVLTPTAAIVAAGVAMVGVTAIAESQGRALADLSNRLRVTRDDYDSLAEATENAARRAAATTSLGTADARVAGRTIASSRNFTGGEAELQNLIALSGRLATAMGTDAATAAGKLAEALDRPRQAAEALAASGLRTMDEGLVRTIRSLENQGRVAEAARLTLDAYNRAIGEIAKTPLQRATEELSNAFTRLWQAVQPVVVGVGTVLVQGLTLAVQGIAAVVGAVNQLGAALRDSNVARFFFGDPAVPAATSSASGETALQRQLRLAREANPRILQQRDNREQYGAAREALPGATGDDAALLRSRMQELNEAYRGMQGPVADYLKGLRDQAALSSVAEGAARDLKQAEMAAAEAGGDAAAQAQARILVQERLTNELANYLATMNRATVGVEAQAAATRDGAKAADDARIQVEAETQALRFASEGAEIYAQSVLLLVGQLTQQRDAQQALNEARAISTQEQQLALIQRETELVGAGVVVRERELAILRERQRILNEPGADINSDASQTRLANAGRIAEATQALQRQQAAFQEIERFGTQAFDRIGTAITTAFANGSIQTLKFSNILRATVSEGIQLLLRMAAINPLRNAVGGSNLPTLFGFGGVGATSTGGVLAADAGSTQGALNQAGQLAGLRAAGGFGNLGNAFTGQGLANTGYGWLDGALNTQITSPTLTSTGYVGAGGVPIVDGGSSLSAAGALGGALGIAGGAYGVYSGLNRGGIGGYTQAAGGALTAGLSAAIIAGLSVPVAGWIAAAALAIGGALLPGAQPSGQGQLARTNLATDAMSFEGLGGKRYSQGNRDAATNAVNGISDLVKEIGDKLGGARIGGNAAVGVTNGTLYLEVGPQRAQFGNDEAGAKALGETAARFVLEEFKRQGTVQGPYRGILDASGTQEALAQNLQWYEETYKRITDTTPKLSAFDQTFRATFDQFDPAIAKAQELGLSIQAITEARDKEIAKLAEQKDAQVRLFDQSLNIRALRAAGDAQGADLASFDLQAAQQLKDSRTALEALGMTAEEIASRIARNEEVLAAERLNIQDQYAKQAQQAAEQAAAEQARIAEQAAAQQARLAEQTASAQLDSARTVLDYLNAQALGATSSLSPTARLAEAERQFNAALGSGDARQLTSAADALLTNSQIVFGGATDAYAQREAFVRTTVGQVGLRAAQASGNADVVAGLSAMVAELKASLARVESAILEGNRETRLATTTSLAA